MAVPLNPSVTSIVTQALKRAGRTVPTAAQITEATEHALQEVKADIMLLAPTHPLLRAVATTVTQRGLNRYTTPDDFNEPDTISLLLGPEEWTGTIQDASSQSITFESTLSVTADELVGRYVLITSGTGVEEYREIESYTPGTHEALTDLPWLSIPIVGPPSSTYRIIRDYIQLFPTDTTTELDRIQSQTELGQPVYAAKYGQEIQLYPVPDKSTYGLLIRYWVDLSKLDEEGALFIQLLREWRSIWIQGIAVKSMQRFDEDRYQSELQVYKAMLDFLASQTCLVRQVIFRDV